MAGISRSLSWCKRQSEDANPGLFELNAILIYCVTTTAKQREPIHTWDGWWELLWLQYEMSLIGSYDIQLETLFGEVVETLQVGPRWGNPVIGGVF